MAQYLLSVIHDWDLPDMEPDELQESFALVDAFNTDLMNAGSWVFAGGLEAPASATVVDATRGEAVLSDGPYLEAKEYLGGFWIVEAADLDEALEIARRGSAACKRPVEVRAFQGEPPAEG